MAATWASFWGIAGGVFPGARITAQSRSQALISSNYAEIMHGNQGLSALDGRTTSAAPCIGEAMEGLVIKWVLLTGMLGFVVCAYVAA